MKRDWTFKIVIAYDTLASAIHAKEMSERVAFEMESKVDAWPFQLLAAGWLREHAIRIAAEADMVILAAHGVKELPASVKDWIEGALRQRDNRQAALVALLHHDWTVSAELPPLYGWLQRIAGRNGVEFFCNLDPGQARDAKEPRRFFPELSGAIAEVGSPDYSIKGG